MRALIACVLFAGILAACGVEGPPVPLRKDGVSTTDVRAGGDSAAQP